MLAPLLFTTLLQVQVSGTPPPPAPSAPMKPNQTLTAAMKDKAPSLYLRKEFNLTPAQAALTDPLQIGRAHV